MSTITKIALRYGFKPFSDALTALQPFDAGNLTGFAGEADSGAQGGYGRLYTCRCGFGTDYKVSVALHEVRYTVSSFQTPIAYRKTSGEWAVEKCGHSSATTRHQNLISAALEPLLSVSV